MCPDFPQKWQTHAGLSCNLPLGGLGVLGLDSWRSTLIFLGGVTSACLTISLTVCGMSFRHKDVFYKT